MVEVGETEYIAENPAFHQGVVSNVTGLKGSPHPIVICHLVICHLRRAFKSVDHFGKFTFDFTSVPALGGIESVGTGVDFGA